MMNEDHSNGQDLAENSPILGDSCIPRMSDCYFLFILVRQKRKDFPSSTMFSSEIAISFSVSFGEQIRTHSHTLN